MKNRAILVFMIVLILLSGCKAQKSSGDTSTPVPQGDVTPQPHSGSETVQVSDKAYSGAPEITVADSVAYLFCEQKGNELYAACEYKNTSNAPCTVTGITYVLDISGKEMTVKSVQPASKYCIILPGESFYHAMWKTYTCMETDTIQVKSVSVTCEKTKDEPFIISADDLYIVQNYPAFSSISGTLHGADENVALNQIGVGMYDKSGKLIGVWFFTEPAELAAGKDKHFITHLRSLPIEGLAENTVEMKATGFGFNTK
ncbi:MAG: hypothetical protein IJO93_03425 [Clostridia bacterium]|nr:hypothetical protein [Clostridia bacterium]